MKVTFNPGDLVRVNFTNVSYCQNIIFDAIIIEENRGHQDVYDCLPLKKLHREYDGNLIRSPNNPEAYPFHLQFLTLIEEADSDQIERINFDDIM